MEREDSNSKIVEFMPRELFDSDMEEQFTQLASRDGETVVLPRELSRKRVTQAFMDAFELIGGTPRLALWADAHPTDFYKLYAKLFPSQASKDLDPEHKFHVIHVLPRTELDE